MSHFCPLVMAYSTFSGKKLDKFLKALSSLLRELLKKSEIDSSIPWSSAMSPGVSSVVLAFCPFDVNIAADRMRPMARNKTLSVCIIII